MKDQLEKIVSAALEESTLDEDSEDEDGDDEDSNPVDVSLEFGTGSGAEDLEKKTKIKRRRRKLKKNQRMKASKVSSDAKKRGIKTETISISNLMVIQSGNPMILVKSDLLISIKCSYTASIIPTSDVGGDDQTRKILLPSITSSVISIQDHISSSSSSSSSSNTGHFSVSKQSNSRVGKEGENVISSIGPAAPSLSFILMDPETQREKSSFNLGDVIRIQIRMSDESEYCFNR